MKENSEWYNSWERLLRKQGSPVIEFKSDGKNSILLSAANLWTLAIERKRELYLRGMRKGDILVQESHSQDLVINIVACAIGGWIFWPIKKSDTTKFSYSKNENKLKIFMYSDDSLMPVQRDEIDLSFLTDEDVLILSTSGTSGVPRIVSYSSKSLLSQIYNINKGLDCQPGSSRLIVLPFHHCFGLILDFLAGLFAKQCIHIFNHDAFNPQKILNLIILDDIKHISLVPRMLDILVKYLDNNITYRSLVKNVQIHCGGAKISDRSKNKIESWVPELVEGYGMTEMTGGVLLRGISNGCQVKFRHIGDPEQNLYELCVKSDSMGNFANRNQYLDSEGYYVTNDVFIKGSHGDFKYVGRLGSILKSTDGTWVDLSKIKDDIEKKFGTEVMHIDLIGGQLQLTIQSMSPSINLINDYLQKYYGIRGTIINLPNDELVYRILTESSKKSASEAIFEWNIQHLTSDNLTTDLT